MIENIIGWALILLLPALAVYIVVRMRRRLEKIRQERHEAEMRIIEERAKQARERERQRAKERAEFEARLNGIGVKAKSTFDPVTNTVKTTVKDTKTGKTVNSATPTHTPSATQSVNDWMDPLTTLILADMITNNKDTVAGTVTWKDDVPTIKETDFGLDDSDSRKSISSTFSDWSDSSSSSDSGPSSDW